MNEQTSNFSAGAQALVDNASRLGLTWTLRPGVVATASPLSVLFDGDTTPIAATSLMGLLTLDLRVQGLLVPPSGAFVIGVTDQGFTGTLGITKNLNQAGSVGSTTSASFASMPGVPTLTFTKKYPSTVTNLKATMSTGAFSSVANTGIEFAILIDGTDRSIMTLLINAVAVHVYFSATTLLTGLAIGTYSAVGRWRRVSGTGTLQSDANDWTSMTLDEVWAV